VEQGAGRGLHRVAVDAYASALWNDYGVESGAFGGAGYRPEVSGVGKAVENHHQRHPSFFEKCRHELVEPVVADR
jgi:hypothetical protein